MTDIKKEREQEIIRFELQLNVEFPTSYREFLIEYGNMEIVGLAILGIPEEEQEETKKEEEGTVLFFRPGDLTRGKFAWISNYQERIVGLCNLTNCRYCNLAERKLLKDFKGGKLKVNLAFYQRETSEFYIAHFVSFPKPEPKTERREIPKKDVSVIEATQFLIGKRPELAGKKLIPICFKEDLNTGKLMALCMDLSENPEDDAPLVQISDIDDQQAEPAEHDPRFFSEWVAFLKASVIEVTYLRAARRRIENRNNEILKKALKKEFERGEFKSRFGAKCPVCEQQERGTHLACSQCFDEWRQKAKSKLDFVEWVQKKVEEKGYNPPCFTHKGIKIIKGEEVEPKYIQVKPQHWHSRIFRVADYVVGLTAFRYSYQVGCLEVDAFWSGDLAGYAKGQAIRNLAIAVLSEANSLTGSLALSFTRDIRENEKTGKIADRNWRKMADKLPKAQKEEAEKNNGRISCPVPQKLVEFAEAHYILLSQAEQGVISHQDGLNLFWAALGWPEHLQARVDELEKKGYLTKQALASVIYSGIWPKEEAVWIFENAPRPEAVLLGSDVPEDRLYYTESLCWGRSAYLANLLKIKVSADLADGLSVEEREESDCELESYGGFWILRAVRDFNLPWMVKGSDPVPVKANKPVLILSIPCQTTKEANDLEVLKSGFKVLRETQSEAKIRCLLVGFEFSDMKYGMKVAEFIKENSKKLAAKGVYLIFSPYRLDLLNDEVENRMASARRKRQFPARKTCLHLQLFEIPKERWQKPDLLYSVEDAKSAAYWIEKKIDQRLGRIRFRVNCSCIERIAVQDTDAKRIAAVNGQDSKDILTAMTSESGITLPFVLPSEMPEFVKKTNGKLHNVLKTIKGGLVAVATFEKSEFLETTLEITETAASIVEAHSVNSNFQFPVNPDDVDFENYAVNRPEEIARTHQQIQQALRNGEPLAVSYLRHEVFVETIREYLFCDVSYDIETTYEERRIAFFTERVKREKKTEIRNPAEPVNLRIVYNDGTEGQPFPLFCLASRPLTNELDGLFQMKVGSISMRHVALDSVTDGYLIQNIMISKRRLSSADQEDYAFRRTWYFLANFVDLVQHKRIKEITREIRFRYLWNVLKLKDKKSKGCELHIFQTGLVPATVGIYRAVVKFLQERRGELVVVPRLIGGKAASASKKEEETVDAAYLKAAEWF